MKHHFLRNILIILIVICAVSGGGIFLKDRIREKAVSVIGNQVIEKAAESMGIPADQADQILNSMSAEDRQTVTDIISEHLDTNTLSQAQQYLKDGDLAGAKQFAENKLSEEEKAELKDIAVKYADQINSLQQ